ncbi:MAG: hypothetical protein IKD31_02765 [Clostridia bacterium]|nr:hypothetical protein [Clostridia bacterium]
MKPDLRIFSHKKHRASTEKASFSFKGKIRRKTGKIKTESTVSYSFCLPEISHPETRDLLTELADAYLRFLEKKSREPAHEVRFGGLDHRFEKGTLVLYAAFCPFRERNFSPVAVLLLEKDGALAGIRMPSRKQSL